MTGRQLPTWLSDGDFSAAELRAVLGGHIEDEVSHFRGKVWAWDVVNEPLDDDGGLRRSIWSDHLGAGYIADAFRWARAADPGAKLYLNEYNAEGINPKSDALYALVRGLLADGVPIDGVGFQTHWTLRPLPSSFEANLRRFAALGLDVAITELDDGRIGIPAVGWPLVLGRILGRLSGDDQGLIVGHEAHSGRTRGNVGRAGSSRVFIFAENGPLWTASAALPPQSAGALVSGDRWPSGRAGRP